MLLCLECSVSNYLNGVSRTIEFRSLYVVEYSTAYFSNHINGNGNFSFFEPCILPCVLSWPPTLTCQGVSVGARRNNDVTLCLRVIPGCSRCRLLVSGNGSYLPLIFPCLPLVPYKPWERTATIYIYTVVCAKYILLCSKLLT